MQPENSSFHKSISELIEIFKILRQRAEKEGITEKEKTMFDQFDRIIGDYKLMSANIPPDYIDEAGKPFRDLLSGMVEKLKTELGIQTADNQNVSDRNDEIAPSEAGNELQRIEIELAKCENEEQINTLLDQRAKILANRNNASIQDSGTSRQDIG